VKVLVTGARGQVGSEIVQEGIKRGMDILAAGRDELDITVEAKVSAYFQAEKPDIVINAAAYTAVDKAESEPDLAYAINRDATANLARACAELDIPLLHISTDYVFDGKKQGAYTEADIPNPQCVYGKSKLEGEQAIKSISAEHIILRVSWVFGANGNNFVKTMLRLGREKDLLKVVADQHGGPTWAGAIANTLLDIVKRWGDETPVPWGIYHYCGQPSTSWHGFAEAIFNEAVALGLISGRPEVEPITTAEYPTAAERPMNSVLDCRNLAKKLAISQPAWSAGLNNVLKS
jgi:dTDP-4-dehydrorhamnose reductase